MSSGARPPFHNPRIDWSNSLTALLKHAWFVAPVGGAESTTGKQYIQDIVRRGVGWDFVGVGNPVPAGITGQLGFGLRHAGTSETLLKTTNVAERYGSNATVPITIAVWLRVPDTVLDFGTLLSKYSSSAFHYGFSFYTYNTTGRTNTFGLSYFNGGVYSEAHAGSSALAGGETALLAWSGKFGTASSHMLYKNSKPITPTWFTSDGTYTLADNSTDPQSYLTFDDVWTQPLGSGGIIYSIMLWDRILSASEHIALYNPQTRFSFIEPQAPPRFWSIQHFSTSLSSSSSRQAYMEGAGGDTSTSSSRSAFAAGKTPYALRPNSNI